MRTLFALLLTLSMVTLSCSKESTETARTQAETEYIYDVVFAFEADESVEKFVIQTSDDARTWKDVATVLPTTMKAEYVVPVPAILTGQYVRVKGVTTAQTVYYTHVTQTE